jgi:hypothetical protein
MPQTIKKRATPYSRFKALVSIALLSCAAASAEGVSQEALLARLRPLASDRVTFKWGHDPAGRLRINIAGDRYDGRRLIEVLTAQPRLFGENGWLRDIDLEIEVNALTGFGGNVLRGFSLRLKSAAGEIQDFFVKSDSGSRFVARLGIAPEQRSAIDLDADDAGSLFRALNLYGLISGGHLSLTVDMADQASGASVGNLTIRGFILRQPELASLYPNVRLSRGGATERGVEFSVMQLKLKVSSGHIVIDAGYACNPRLMAELKGNVDLPRNDVKVRGNLLLAFGREINREMMNAESGNPELLNYYATGSIRAPAMQLNPIGMMALSAKPLLDSCLAAQLQQQITLPSKP